MWEQKKGNAPPVYPPLYGQPSGQQMPGQPPMQSHQQFQSMAQPTYHSMPGAGHMGGPQVGAGLAQGLGPPPPYTPYSDSQSAQQQMKYMQQMAYNPSQYMPTSSASPLVPPQSASIAGAHGYAHNPYASNPYQTPGLYNPYNPYQNLPPNSTVVLPQGFDAGARFDGVSRPLIPPPPPGVAPNAAQMAAMQGQNVVIGQKKGSFLEGGSSGGYTFW